MRAANGVHSMKRYTLTHTYTIPFPHTDRGFHGKTCLFNKLHYVKNHDINFVISNTMPK